MSKRQRSLAIISSLSGAQVTAVQAADFAGYIAAARAATVGALEKAGVVSVVWSLVGGKRKADRVRLTAVGYRVKRGLMFG